MPDPTNKRRRAGRRRGPKNDVERALLEAARAEFAAHGFASTTLKGVAAEADVNVAMIRYYFRDKQGLYEAVLRSTLRDVIGKLVRNRGTPQTSTRRFIHNFMQLMGKNPWLPALILRELAADRSRLHRVFMSEFVSGLLPELLETITHSQHSGELDAGVDPRLAAQSLLAMTLLPFALLPMAAPVFGLTLRGRDLKALINHTERIFLAGVGSG